MMPTKRMPKFSAEEIDRTARVLIESASDTPAMPPEMMEADAMFRGFLARGEGACPGDVVLARLRGGGFVAVTVQTYNKKKGGYSLYPNRYEGRIFGVIGRITYADEFSEIGGDE
jgi:hypothetical protein